jgi:hypothetical protein
MTLIRGTGGGGGGGGGKGGGGSSSTPTTAPNSLFSTSYANIVDLIGEGEIYGLKDGMKSIYFDNTPLQNPDGTLNFPLTNTDGSYNFQNVTLFTRNGTQSQSYIPGFDAISNEVPVVVTVLHSIPVVRTITDTTTNAARVTVTLPQLQNIDSQGNVNGASVELQIAVQYNGGGFTTIIDDTISGHTSQQYQRSYVFGLNGTFPVDIKVTRVTGDSTTSLLTDAFAWTSYTEINYKKLGYPNSALIALRVDAEQFSSIPSRSYWVRGIKVKIPSNATVDQTNGRLIYSGVWDGTFGAAQWTSDPAWCLWDLLTSTRYGFGNHVDTTQLDKWAFYSCSQYASTLVADGFGGYEPRFSCNVNIQQETDAFKLINDMASVFRAMPFWSTGALTVSQDKPADPSYLFTLANVEEPGFSYSGSSLKTRPNVAQVAYLDLNLRNQAYEVVEDAASIAKYGVIKTAVTAFACTSRGQAHRLGKWLIYAGQYETETVSFVASIDAGVIVRPGQIIQISDPVRAGARQGGRISSATTTTVTVDNATGLTATNSPTLSVILSDGTVATSNVTGISGNVITVSPAFASAPNANSVWVLQTSALQTTTWRVLTVQEQDGARYAITALSYNSSKYNYIEDGIALQTRSVTNLTAVPNAPTNVIATEVLYELNDRVLSKLVVSWQAVPGVNQYRLQWRRSTGNWTTVTVTSPSYEILDTSPDTYQIQVSSLNSALMASQVATLNYTAYGRNETPQDVTGLMLVPIDQTSAILSWNLAPDLNVRVGGSVLIRHSMDTVAPQWDQATDIVPSASGSQTQKQVPLLEGTYLVRFETSSGFRSTNSAMAVTHLPTPQPRYQVQLDAEDATSPPFQGTKTNMVYDSTEVGLVLTRSSGAVASSGSYQFASTLDLGATYDVNIQRRLQTFAYLPDSLWDSKLGLIDDWSTIDDTNIDQVNASVQVRTTTDNPSGSPTWSAWADFSNATVRGRGLQFQLNATSNDTAQNIIIRQLGVLVEMQQRVEQSATLTSSAGTYTVTFANAFYQAPSVGITSGNMATGDYFTITSVTTTGFQVTFENSSGSAISRQFAYTAIGYGRAV